MHALAMTSARRKPHCSDYVAKPYLLRSSPPTAFTAWKTSSL
jgi:hypothetical protein